jgi:hypothetical protein
MQQPVREIWIKYKQSKDPGERRNIATDKWFPVLIINEVSGLLLFYFIDENKKLQRVSEEQAELKVYKDMKDNDLEVSENLKSLLSEMTEVKNIIKHGNVKVKVLDEGTTKVTSKSHTK